MSILDSADTDVSANYEITYECGELTVDPLPITVITEGHSWTYDGLSHSWDGYTLSDETPLVNGHYTKLNTLFEITNVWEGSTGNALTVVVLDADEADMTDNYQITYECGELIIDPLPITVITEGHSWIYDGLSHSWDVYTLSSETPLVAGHKTEVKKWK